MKFLSWILVLVAVLTILILISGCGGGSGINNTSYREPPFGKSPVD